MQLDEQTLRDTVESIVEAMLGPGSTWTAAPGVGAAARQVAIDVSGETSARVLLAADESFARRVAMTMFELPSPELSEDDVVDAFRELTNMTGGAIKSMLDGECQLGLPVLVTAAGDLCGSPIWCGALEHGGDVLQVQVNKKDV